MSYVIGIVAILLIGVIVLMGGMVMMSSGQVQGMASVIKEAIAWGSAFILGYSAVAAIAIPSQRI